MNTQLKDRPTTGTGVETPEQAPHHQPVSARPAERTRASGRLRGTGRWIVLVMAIVTTVGAVAVLDAVTGDSSSPDVQITTRPAFDSPGGNSLNLGPTRLPEVSTERPAFDSPGGHSLNTRPQVRESTSAERPAFDSPGGNSLNTRPQVRQSTSAGAPSGFDSPGGNSLNTE